MILNNKLLKTFAPYHLLKTMRAGRKVDKITSIAKSINLFLLEATEDHRLIYYNVLLTFSNHTRYICQSYHHTGNKSLTRLYR